MTFLITPQAGFEPATNRLTADRSTTELLRNAQIFFILAINSEFGKLDLKNFPRLHSCYPGAICHNAGVLAFPRPRDSRNSSETVPEVVFSVSACGGRG